MPPATVYDGGAPCQSYSPAGYKAGRGEAAAGVGSVLQSRDHWVTIHTDASKYGWGCTVEERRGGGFYYAHGLWPEEVTRCSSNFRGSSRRSEVRTTTATYSPIASYA